jgi:hypothetical protein
MMHSDAAWNDLTLLKSCGLWVLSVHTEEELANVHMALLVLQFNKPHSHSNRWNAPSDMQMAHLIVHANKNRSRHI